MARSSKSALALPEQVTRLKELLDTFNDRIEQNDLRQQVCSLIPVIHALRDLGSTLIRSESASSARDRILVYLRKYSRTVIDGDELLVVSGIGEWARRVRELRVEFGWTIYTGATLRDVVDETPEILDELKSIIGKDAAQLKTNQYILMKEGQDREAALRWNQLNSIRKKSVGVKSKLLEYLRLNAGRTVTGEELRY